VISNVQVHESRKVDTRTAKISQGRRRGELFHTDRRGGGKSRQAGRREMLIDVDEQKKRKPSLKRRFPDWRILDASVMPRGG